MRTVGVDLAAEPVNTGIAVIEWRSGTAEVVVAECPGPDEAVLRHVQGAAKVGIDCPLGWPDTFVDFLVAHRDARGEPPGDPRPDPDAPRLQGQQGPGRPRHAGRRPHPAAPWLRLGAFEQACWDSDHVFDAVVAALLARAAALGLTTPPPTELRDAATREGWIAPAPRPLDDSSTPDSQPVTGADGPRCRKATALGKHPNAIGRAQSVVKWMPALIR